ncbi:MAG: M23 family metallopeptidase [Solirubrobacterales bacterium]|nr:M23 family metallopeptidase [Solirubrobacterales bacterium]
MLIRSRTLPLKFRHAALVAAVFLLVPPAASASVDSGGSGFVATPKIKKIACEKACTGAKQTRRVRGGGVIRVAGENLDKATKFVFVGASGARDDVAASAISATSGVARVKVPLSAQSGPVSVIGESGVAARSGPRVTVLPAPPVIGAPDLKSVPTGLAGVTLKAGTSTPRAVFLGAQRLVSYSFQAAGASDLSAEINLVNTDTRANVASWKLAAPPGRTVSVLWNGKTKDKDAATGRYAFRTTLVRAGGVAASQAAPIDNSRDAFDLYPFVFPVAGRHTYGTGGARFGGGRGHEGFDVLANCGVKLVAARGGIVRRSGNQGAAGNYIVITPDGDGVGDQAYLHLSRPSPFKAGDRIYTGQQIGTVGDTGRTSACLLHFEQWTGEIWRSKPVDPYPALKAWDLVS